MTAIDLSNRVAIVTGAAAGLGKVEALTLASHGANLVLTDIGEMDQVIAEATALGVKAVGVQGDISDWSLAAKIMQAALENFGSIDIVVNNAGITRDAMIFNMTEQQWDQVVDIHLKGHAALIGAVTAYWRNLGKETGAPVYGRIINTSSEAALTGSAGQPNYAAAKAGIIALTTSAARAVEKYGVTVNAICPRARTGMTAGVFASEAPSENDPLDPQHVARLVATLASPQAAGINAKTFVVYGRALGVVAEPKIEEEFQAAGSAFTEAELLEALAPLSGRKINGNISADLARVQELSGFTQ